MTFSRSEKWHLVSFSRAAVSNALPCVHLHQVADSPPTLVLLYVCWPEPQLVKARIARQIRPGGADVSAPAPLGKAQTALDNST